MPQERWERLGHPSPRFVPILIRAHLILNIINIHRDLCLRTCWVRIAGGGAAPSALHPTTRFYFLTALFFTYSHSWVRIAGGGFDRSLCYLVYCLFSKTLLLWVQGEGGDVTPPWHAGGEEVVMWPPPWHAGGGGGEPPQPESLGTEFGALSIQHLKEICQTPKFPCWNEV